MPIGRSKAAATEEIREGNRASKNSEPGNLPQNGFVHPFREKMVSHKRFYCS
jgi:hypothetical protein